jgi:hypothetical protein
MNAVVHNASGTMIKRAIENFGRKLVSESKNEVIGHFTASDIDDVADAILDKATNDFLDKALKKRLETIDARSLINALARAERLGYENDDVMDERPVQAPVRSVTYMASSVPYAHAQSRHEAQQRPTSPKASQHSYGNEPAASQAPRPTLADLQCPLCWRKFNAAAPYEYVC